MSADVALAGIVFCADDWASYDPGHRAELIAAAMGEASFYELAEGAGEWDPGRRHPQWAVAHDPR